MFFIGALEMVFTHRWPGGQEASQAAMKNHRDVLEELPSSKCWSLWNGTMRSLTHLLLVLVDEKWSHQFSAENVFKSLCGSSLLRHPTS